MRSMHLAGLALVCLGFTAARGAAPASTASGVTVLLFQTEAVQGLHISAQHASLHRCAACKPEPLPSDTDLQLRQGSMRDGSGQVIYSVEADGAATLRTSGGQHAEAAGHWSIVAERDRLRVRVALSRERYVEAVLTAEASPEEPQASLEALAVVARSFAAAAPARHPGGALCDSTHCQALRLERVTDAIRNAVWATSGETLWLGTHRVPAYFSEHCGGYTEDAGAIWGGPPQPWLVAHPDAWCARVPSAWRASLAEADIRRALAEEGFAVTGPIREIGIVARDHSGRVEQVRIVAGQSVRTLPASTLRFALNRSLGWNQLRSDRYQARRVGDHILFEGSGYGHGVGLCQAGAAAMARAGKGAREILHDYFPGAALRVNADDSGWFVAAAHGFTLRSTTRDSALGDDAARGYAEARQRWGEPVRITPAVTVFPTAETFREATGRPGWDLADTLRDRIATQSPAALRAHGGTAAVFRHEFLHTFAEANASASAPLWLREGLVEILNGETCPAHSIDTPAAVDAALRSAASIAASQRAHTQSCSLVKELIAQRGMTAARSMLQQQR